MGADKLYIHKVLLITKLALVIVLGFVAVRTAVVLRRTAGAFVPISAVGTQDTGTMQGKGSADTSAKNYSAIIRRNIFCGADSLQTTSKLLWDENVAGSVESVEEELGLELIGTIAGSPLFSRAIIKDAKSKIPQLYKIGGTVAGARIQSIQKDAVILLHNGQSKILRLHIGRDHTESRTGAALAKSSKRDKVVQPILPLDESGPKIPVTLGHLENILDKAIIEPHMVNGQTEGLRVTGLENIPFVKNIGIKDGDIIRQVNGHHLTSKRKAYQVFQKARTQPELNMELLHQGKTKELSFDLR